MNILIYSDFHIKNSELKECELVGNEIISLCKKYNVTKVISLGDNFDTSKPSSLELSFFASFLKTLNCEVILIAANSHESETPEDSIVNHFGILSDKVTVVKEYQDGDHMYCGHFTLVESKYSFGAKHSKNDFKNYKYVFLGHQHSYEIVKPNICQLGAVRYVDFAESQDKAKVVCLIENYGEDDKEKVSFLGLKYPFHMVDVTLSPDGKITQPGSIVAQSEEEFKAILDKLDSLTKVRVIFKDFKSYTQVINSLANYKNKFLLFKEKKEFLISENNDICLSKETVDIKESLIKFLEEQKIDKTIKNILLEEIN